MTAERTAQLFKALSVEPRVRIIELLRRRHLCVGALARNIGITQSAVSQHLRILRDAGLVKADRRGFFVHYHVNEHALEKLRDAVSGLIEAGSADDR